MDNTTIATTATRVAAKSIFKLKKYAPEILTGVGIVGVVAAGVIASRATLKLEPILENARDGLETVEGLTDAGKYETKQDRAKELAVVYTNAGIDLIKLYGPAVTLAAGSVACILGAHGIMRQRNATLLVAYTALESTYNKYRERVIEELGVDQERDIFAGIREEEIEDEKGKKKIVARIEDEGSALYAKMFSKETNPNWEPDALQNRYFLESVQTSANDLLHSRGFVFLNEIYADLGYEPTHQGQIVGWIRGEGDNYIDFGMHDITNEAKRAFILGHEKSVLLDFNVDGPILNRVKF